MGALIILSTDASAADEDTTKYRRIPMQYIAALAAPEAVSGNGAEQWGVWQRDPGPRGVRLRLYDRLVANGGEAPARWQFDTEDWWLEENGLIMEAPKFSIAPGKYVVTGGRQMASVLTIHEPDENGVKAWDLSDDMTIADVTHLKCRSARYTPAAGAGTCTPAKAQQSDFPVTPGGAMPPVEGCDKRDYTVLFIVGIGVEE